MMRKFNRSSAMDADPSDWETLDDPSDDDSDGGYPDWFDHPSLSAEERNSLMGAR
jgi:hypothetical protein